ncbi:hypothetical protein AB9T89_10485 [Flavobacterium oncorhynchi]|uniref:hypothetical protein n=1 Tax=Flavobacterium oncorhynchi TaxID=728056 RepID=UPI003519E3F9
MITKLQNVLRPVLESQLPLKEQKLILNEMFVLAISNAPENETDNFTAKKMAPVFLALSELLEQASEIS